MGKPAGYIVLGILRVLEESGPMTRKDIEIETKIDKSLVSPVISRLNKQQKTRPKRIYIREYVYESEDGRGLFYPRAVYAVGDLPDARKPKPMSTATRNRRYRDRNKTFVSSVFALGIANKYRRVGVKGLV